LRNQLTQGDEGAAQRANSGVLSMKAFSVGLAIIAFAALGLASNANAEPIVFSTTLSGPNESPPNASPGTGTALVTFDLTAHTMRVETTFSGLLGGVTASHIHCCTAIPLVGTAGVATVTPTFTGFPSGVTFGTYDHTFNTLDLGTYNTNPMNGFIVSAFDLTHDAAGAETALFNAMVAGKTYLNIHTTVVPGGEIRGFLLPVPEPVTLSLFGAGLAGMIATRRKRAKQA
jgi:hypothetical protein